MTHRFIVDANLPVALARQLSKANWDCVHVLELPGLTMPDPAIWALAIAQTRTIISRDGDFAQLAVASSSGPSVIWLRMGNVRRSVLLGRMQHEWPKIVLLLDAGERLFEVR